MRKWFCRVPSVVDAWRLALEFARSTTVKHKVASDLDSGVKETPKNNSKGSPAAPFYVADSLQLNIRA